MALAAVATLWLAAPVARAPTERMFGAEIVGRQHDAYTVARWFEHPGAATVYTQPASDYPGALVARVTGGVAAYNLIVLATFPLAAWFAYLLAFRWTGSRPASWIASLAFAFSPFHLAHAAYHPQVAQIQWLPLYLLALFLAVERASALRLAFLAAALALASLSNFYGALIVAVVTPVALAGFGWTHRRSGDPGAARRTWAAIGVLAAVGIAGLTYLFVVAPDFWRQRAAYAFPSTDVERYTARWYSYFVPPIGHPLFGRWASAFWSSRGIHGELVEQQVTIGFGLTALALAACLLWWRHRRTDRFHWVPAVAVLGGFALLLSLPPRQHVGPLSIPMPSALLAELLPMFRAHARFGAIVLLATATLAGIGFDALRRRGGVARAAGIGLLGLAIVELAPWPPWRWHDVLPTPAHRWLAEHEPDARVLDCVAAADPVEQSVPWLYGKGLIQLGPGEDCGEPDLAARLVAEQISHLIVRDGTRLADFLGESAPRGTELIRAFPGARIFHLTRAAPAPYLVPGEGFFAREYHDGRTYRWAGNRATLGLINPTGARLRLRVELTLAAFPRPRAVTIALDGEPLAPPFELPTATQTHVFGPIELRPGAQTLTIVAEGQADSAAKALGGDDERALAFGLWEWRLEAVPAGRA